MANITYTINGVDFKDYGVFVSDSDGIVNRPKLKPMASFSWDDYHGEVVDLNRKVLAPREITLSCFIKADSRNEFVAKLLDFEQVFNNTGTQRLVINAVENKPLIYEVYCKDEISVLKKWNDTLMVGTFKLKLIEPEPVKRVIRFMPTSIVPRIITLTSNKALTVYWGDGSITEDVRGENITISHTYDKSGTFYAVITGVIEEITNFSTPNGTIVWDKI